MESLQNIIGNRRYETEIRDNILYLKKRKEDSYCLIFTKDLDGSFVITPYGDLIFKNDFESFILTIDDITTKIIKKIISELNVKHIQRSSHKSSILDRIIPNNSHIVLERIKKNISIYPYIEEKLIQLRLKKLLYSLWDVESNSKIILFKYRYLSNKRVFDCAIILGKYIRQYDLSDELTVYYFENYSILNISVNRYSCDISRYSFPNQEIKCIAKLSYCNTWGDIERHTALYLIGNDFPYFEQSYVHEDDHNINCLYDFCEYSSNTDLKIILLF